MQETNKSYRSLIKSTSIFGGVQFFKIIIAIVKSKIIALLLGPTGLGVLGLFNTTIGLITSLTNFGLSTSAVKDIAAASESGDEMRISRVTFVVKRLLWVTGIIGAILTFFLSSKLSQFTFGNDDYKFAFMWLSSTLIFSQLTIGNIVLLQGMRKLNLLAKVNVIGSFIGLVLSVPFYYYLRLDGIVPAMIVSIVSLFLVSIFYYRKINFNSVRLNLIETLAEGKGMLKMGFLISLTGFIANGVSYLLRIYISNYGDLVDVGLYTAGFTIIGTYVGLVFTAMSTDYYPRLSGVSDDNKKTILLINQQAEISILILAPILTVFLIFSYLAIIFLYSNEFTSIDRLIQWSALGMYFKAVSWAISFIFLAKGASIVFFWNELIWNVYFLVFSLLGYYLDGLDGLGIAFFISYVLYLIQVFLVAKNKYEFKFELQFYRVFIIQFLLGLGSFIAVISFSKLLSYIAGLIFITTSILFSFKELDKRMDLKAIINNFRNKNQK